MQSSRLGAADWIGLAVIDGIFTGFSVSTQAIHFLSKWSHGMDNTKAPIKKSATESDAKSVDGKSGRSNKTSHNAKSHTKAGTNVGAGGGKKQERHH